MTKIINVTCEKCKESFIFTSGSSFVEEVLDEGHYICFTCEDEKSEDTKMTREMKRPTSHISGNSIKPALSKDEYIDYLESKLSNAKPQQSLPVVPEDVAEQIERVRNNNGTYTTLGLFDSNYDKKPDYAKWIEDNINEFMVACSVGYTVEKPKVFFLKNTLTHDYLYHKYKNSLGEQSYCKAIDDKPLDYCLFTLDEINSMNTGSYEQIEVN